MLKHNIRLSSVLQLNHDMIMQKSTMLKGDEYSSWLKANVGVRQDCVVSNTL